MWDHVRTGLGRTLLIAGVVLGSYWLGIQAVSLAEQHRLGGRLGSLQGTSRIASPVVVARATRAEANAEGLVGRISIPRVGLDAMVLEGDDDGTLSRGVGHIPHTAFPGERANAGIAGHRDTYFRQLHQVQRGDAIRFTTPDGTFHYAVDRILIVPPGRADVLARGDSARITLVTCYPFHYIGPAPKRYVVQGHWVQPGSAFDEAGPQPTSAEVEPGEPSASASPLGDLRADEPAASKAAPPRPHRAHPAAPRVHRAPALPEPEPSEVHGFV